MKRSIKIKQIISVLSIILLFNSCFDLEPENFSKIDSDTFPNTEADIRAAVVGCYNVLGTAYVMRYIQTCDLVISELTTDALNTSWGDPWEQLNKFTWVANNMAPKDLYFRYQQGITKSTKIIDVVQKSDMLEKDKARGVAELKALRAFFMFRLYSLFGPIPVVTDPTVANDVTQGYSPSKPSREDYVNFMINDIEASYKDLGVSLEESERGRFTQGATLMTLLKIYLHEKRFDKVEEIANRIEALGVYDNEIKTAYKDIFAISNENINNKDAMLYIGRIPTNSHFSWSWFACVLPATPLYRSPAGTNITVWGGIKTPWAYYDKFEPADKRLVNLLRYYTDTDKKTVDFRAVDHPKATGAIPMKYSEDPNQKGEWQGTDVIVYRYTDVVLCKAEALNEINGPTDEAISLINKVRDRAGVAKIKLSDYDKNSLRDFILEERARELYCEGHRRDDLIRHGKYIEYAQARGAYAQDYHVLFPIPQTALDENSNIKQNTGYEK